MTMNARSWRNRSTMLAVLILFSSCASSARAALVFAPGASNYNVGVGQTASVTISLVETGGSQLGGNGLQSAAVWVERNAGSLPSSPAAITGHTLNTTAFTGSTFVNSSSTSERNVTLQTPTGASSGPTGPSILLMTLTLTGGNSAGVTTFTIKDDSAFDETLTFGPPAVVLDSAIGAGSFTITTVVPEPSGVAALAVVATFATGVRRRCRRD